MSTPASSSAPGRMALIGCRVLEREIAALGGRGRPFIRSELLQDSLHDQPALLNRLLAGALASAEADPSVDAVVLVYGACGMAIAGLAPARCPLVVPRAHDCISLLLGSKERYAACMRAEPSLFWYTPGWCRSGRMPGPDRERTLRKDYAGRFDAEQTDTLIEMDRESLACHSTAAYTDLSLPGDAEEDAYASHCAKCLGWTVTREAGNPSLLKDLLSGRWDDARFLVVRPGEQIAASPDPDLIIKAVPHRP